MSDLAKTPDEYLANKPIVRAFLEKNKGAMEDFQRCFKCKFMWFSNEDEIPFAKRLCNKTLMDRRKGECKEYKERWEFSGYTVPDFEE